MSEPKFKAGDRVQFDGAVRKIIRGPIEGAHVEAYHVEDCGGIIPADALTPAKPTPAAAEETAG